MIVYGDRARTVYAGEAFDQLAERLAGIALTSAGLSRHSALVGVLIEASALHQAIADDELDRAGEDEDTPAQAVGSAVLIQLARHVASSWDDMETGSPPIVDLGVWRALVPEGPLKLRTAEGFAHYAVYPEAYLETARAEPWSATPFVIGLRSIGAALAAMTAAAWEPAAPLATLRPVGHPFDRRLVTGPLLERRILDHAGPYALVDEGPGLSGSSFAAAADFLEARGVARERIVFLPSHAGAPGPMAGGERLRRWAWARRPSADFDARIGRRRLTAWTEDRLGPLNVPLQDLSGGDWRARSQSQAPAVASLERRKFLAETASGTWLLRFAGLDAAAAAKARRAEALAQAGFTPRTAGLLHGFLAEAWLTDARPLTPEILGTPWLIEHLARYIAFRARRFPAGPEDGADRDALVSMARFNTASALGEEIGEAVGRTLDDLAIQAPASRFVHVDGRMHAWEWLVTPGGALLKTDAVDHSCGHDIVGCQDPAWDVAGCALEFCLSETEIEQLTRAVVRAGGPVTEPRLLALHLACYAAFQLGLWSLAGDGERTAVDSHIHRYREALLRLAHPSRQGDAPWTERRFQAR